MSSFSHDDLDQWPLIPHFISHYRDHLGIDPARFLLILHSDQRNVTGLMRMARWLHDLHGVGHSFPITEPYTSRRHMLVKWELLRRHVCAEDWVVHVDSDEFVFFPEGRSASEVLAGLDAAGQNVHYGLMVDRIPEDGDIDLSPLQDISIFEQFPLNCAATLLLQTSDVRKAVAYRGYMRSTSGNHNILGLNETNLNRVKRNPRFMSLLLDDLRSFLSPREFRALPFFVSRHLPEVRPAVPFATIYHLKWIRGLYEKLVRRSVTEDYTVGIYEGVRKLLGTGRRFSDSGLSFLCNRRDLPSSAGESTRSLTQRELAILFLDTRPAFLERELRRNRVPAHKVEPFLAEYLQARVRFGLAREEGRMPIL